MKYFALIALMAFGSVFGAPIILKPDLTNNDQ